MLKLLYLLWIQATSTVGVFNEFKMADCNSLFVHHVFSFLFHLFEINRA